MTYQDRTASAALSGLIILQVTMLSALYAGVAPHPPATTPLFGIAPFVGAAIAAAMAAIVMGPAETRAGRVLGVTAALMALISFGPQKYLDAQIALIWPSVVGGQIAAATIFAVAWRSRSTGARSQAVPC